MLEFAGQVDTQTVLEQAPLTQLEAVLQLCPRLFRQSWAAVTYVFPLGQVHVFKAEFQFPFPEHEQEVGPGPVDVEPPPHAVHGVNPPKVSGGL